jgi:Rps23 Pro-64 3,4-dihydroxylase Tpa1-like proline 4-hydroxylase
MRDHGESMKLVIQQPDVKEIKVKLLLAGGQTATVIVTPDHPLLVQLLAAVAGTPNGAPASHPPLFQVPAENGRASLVFGAHQLVGVVTDPAVLIQPDQAPPAKPAEPEMPSATVGAAAAAAAWGHGDLVRHPVVQIDGFLTGSEVAWLMELAFANESRFVPSRVSDGNDQYRQSLMLAAPSELWQMMTGKIKAVMPEVMPQLRLGRFSVGNIDCQITASVDGSYFKQHTDAGANETYKRQLTYVYYFNRDPKRFAGGELRVYDDTIRSGKLAATESFQLVEPRHNSIVFFQAAVMHEVMPVSMPTRDFRDARFTVNGWIERA